MFFCRHFPNQAALIFISMTGLRRPGRAQLDGPPLERGQSPADPPPSRLRRRLTSCMQPLTTHLLPIKQGSVASHLASLGRPERLCSALSTVITSNRISVEVCFFAPASIFTSRYLYFTVSCSPAAASMLQLQTQHVLIRVLQNKSLFLIIKTTVDFYCEEFIG